MQLFFALSDRNLLRNTKDAELNFQWLDVQGSFYVYS